MGGAAHFSVDFGKGGVAEAEGGVGRGGWDGGLLGDEVGVEGGVGFVDEAVEDFAVEGGVIEGFVGLGEER